MLYERKEEFALIRHEYPREFELLWALATRPDTSAPEWVALDQRLAQACRAVSDGAQPKDALVACGFRITPSPWGAR